MKPKNCQRAELDNKAKRAKNVCGDLANKFFNSSSWNPINEQLDSRVEEIDPSLPPREAYSAERLRSIFIYF